MNLLSLAQTQELEAVLRALRDTLLERIRGALHGAAEPDKTRFAARIEEPGPDDGRDAGAGIAPLSHELADLNEIDAALRRMADGCYGACAACGGAIEARRLAAQPAARICLSCKQAFEKRRGFVHVRI